MPGAHHNGSRARRMPGTQIIDPVPDHDAIGQGNCKLRRGGQKHAGFWFATGAFAAVFAVTVLMKRAIVNALQGCVFTGKHRNHFLMDIAKLIFGKEATRNTRLVCHDNNRNTGIIETRNGARRAGNKFQVFNPRQVMNFFVDHPITIQKHGR